MASKCYKNGKFDVNNPFGAIALSGVWSTDYCYMNNRCDVYFGAGNNALGYINDNYPLSVVCVK